MRGQDPEGYVQGCQLSTQGRGPWLVKSLPRWHTLTTRSPVTRHPPSSNSATASWGSLGWRVFIQKDVLQLCLNWPGLLLQETLEG